MPTAPVKPKRWSTPVGFLFTAVGIPGVFWLKFGIVDGYVIAFTAFILMLSSAIEFLPRATDERTVAAVKKIAPSRFDFLATVWVLSIPFAPFLTWILTNALDVDASNWRVLLGIRAALCVVVPLIAVLPFVRYVTRGTAGIMIPVLVLGTGFPVATGIGAAFDVVAGPAWEDVTVAGSSDIVTRTGGRVLAPDAIVELDDGRSLSRSAKIAIHEGPMHLLILKGFGRIIDTAR